MVKKKYYIQLAGGFANLVFQMNLASYLSKRGHDIILDVYWLNKRNSNALDLVYELFEFEQFKQKKLRFLRYFFMIFGKSYKFRKDKMFKFFNYNYLLGYWQYEFFFNENMFRKLEKSTKMYGCIHYRLGDYRTSKSHEIKKPDYFIDKLNLIKDRYDELFLCTNESSCTEVEYLLKNIENLKLFEGNTKSTFQKLANANFIIGSDSTFSYCAFKCGQTNAYFDENYLEKFAIKPPSWIL